MKDNKVLIKGNKYGLTVILDKDTELEVLKKMLAEKVKEASRFFDEAKLAVTFEGKKLSNQEQKILVDTITENSSIDILCVIENNVEEELELKKKIEKQLEEISINNGKFYRGTLRSGQMLEAEQGIIIIGDVNPGAKVVSKGNIIIIGSLKGTVYAGANGDEKAIVVAVNMSPMQIKIGDILARSPDNHKKNIKDVPQIAYVEKGSIYIKSLDH